jgi:hypothetical protein
MNAKLTVPLAVSALILLTLPANAICWPWQSCPTPAPTQGATATPAPTRLSGEAKIGEEA